MFTAKIYGIAEHEGKYYGWFLEIMNFSDAAQTNPHFGVVELDATMYTDLSRNANGSGKVYSAHRVAVNLGSKPVYVNRRMQRISLAIARDQGSGAPYGTFHLYESVTLQRVVGYTHHRGGSWLYLGDTGSDRTWVREDVLPATGMPRRVWVGRLMKTVYETQMIGRHEVRTEVHEHHFDAIAA